MINNTPNFYNSNDTTHPELSKSFIYDHDDSMKSISDCTTIISELEIMEENQHSQVQDQLQTSFKKQLAKSQLLNSSCNPNAKKSKFLVVESPVHTYKKKEQRSAEFQSELIELEKIERKTQDLMLKQKQLKRQMKKMKKLYIEKAQELMKHQEAHTEETKTLKHRINNLVSQKEELLKEKQMIQQTMNQLEEEAERTKSEILSFKEEREHLIHKIQLLEINFEPISKEERDDPASVIDPSKNPDDLDRQIAIIDRMIKQKKRNNGDPKELSRLLQLKIQYMEERQFLKVNHQRQKQEKKISKLNQVILSRNNLLRSRNANIQQLEREKEQPLCQSKVSQKQQETSDTFFGNNNQTQNEGQNQEQDQTIQWDKFKQQVRQTIESSRIVGHQQSYETIQSIVIGMIHLFEKETCCEEDVIELLDISLDNLNSKYAERAKKNVHKIERMLGFINQNGSKFKRNGNQKENKSVLLRSRQNQ